MNSSLRMSLFALLVIGLTACSPPVPPPLETGDWRAELQTPGGPLPFTFLLEQDSTWTLHIYNGEEDLVITETVLRNDSLFITMPIFDSEIVTRIVSPDSLEGEFRNHARKDHKILPFHAGQGPQWRFSPPDSTPMHGVSGKWEVDFVYQDSIHSQAIAQFKQIGVNVTGTFLTPTGDYRYLEGVVTEDSLYLSCFDGAHSFLFKAGPDPEDEWKKLNGHFWSGAHWYESWTAVRNENASLPAADTLTRLKKGFETLAFSFPNPEGKTISLSNPEYQDKPVIVQIMGTWCPNCRDETRFLVDYLDAHPEQELEVIALAFEVTEEQERIDRNLERLKTQMNVPYEVVYAGKAGPEAVEQLPMLNQIMSYPTTIFIGRDGQVQRIHTGFSGPATGKKYEAWVRDFEELVTGMQVGS